MPARLAWRANCCSPRPQRNLSAKVSHGSERTCSGILWESTVIGNINTDRFSGVLFFLFSFPFVFIASLSLCAGEVDPLVLAKCNPCLSAPCQNQGICLSDPIDVYKCTCPEGFKVRVPACLMISMEVQKSSNASVFCLCCTYDLNPDPNGMFSHCVTG